MSHSNEWAARLNELTEDAHLRGQVERLMEPLRVIEGHRSAPEFEAVVAYAAECVATLELRPETPYAAAGPLLAVRGPMVGYMLLLRGADVFVSQLSPYMKAERYWRASQDTD